MATYKVVSGDSLSKIAQQYGTTVQALASANGIKDPNKISAGATLQIPGSTGSTGGYASNPPVGVLAPNKNTAPIGVLASKSGNPLSPAGQSPYGTIINDVPASLNGQFSLPKSGAGGGGGGGGWGGNSTPGFLVKNPQDVWGDANQPLPDQKEVISSPGQTGSDAPIGVLAPGNQNGVTGKTVVTGGINNQQTGNNFSNSFKSSTDINTNINQNGNAGNTGNTGNNQAPKQFGQTEFDNVINAMRDKMAYNNDLIKARQLMVSNIYDGALSADQLAQLPQNLQAAIKGGDRQVIDMNIRMLNDEIAGRTNGLDQSVNYLTTAYKDDLNRAQQEKDKAITNVMDFVKQYGSQAGVALKSMYGQDYLDQLQSMGINVNGMGNLPNTLSETKTSMQYGSTTLDSTQSAQLQGALNIFKQTGVIPPLGYGANNPLRKAFYAALGGADGSSYISDAQAQKMMLNGAKTALSTQLNQYSANNTSISTLDKQLDLAKQYSDQVDRTDSPLVNKYLLGLKSGVFGDPATAQLNNIIKTASMEFAKILSGAAASISGVTVSSAADAEQMLNSAMSKGQFNAVFNLMKQEAHFRLDSQKETIDNINNDIKGGFNTSGSGGGGDADFWSSFKPEGSVSINAVTKAIGQIESGGRYNAIGPKTNSGDYAYGKYQVMGANIPSWTKQALGYSMTPQQFLNDPQAQDKVAEYKMGNILAQYNDPRQVASIWFSGKPMAGNNAQDVTGTSVPKYIKNFMDALNTA